jgi:hypothetical protein
MVDAFKAIVVLVLLIVGFMIYPAIRVADRTEELAHKAATAAVEEFVDTVRGKGYVEPRDYDILLRKLDGTGMVFDVQLEHYLKTVQPVYVGGVFQDTFRVEHIGYFALDILEVLYPTDPAMLLLASDSADRRYKMHAGDLFQARVESKGRTLSSRLRGMLFRSSTDVPIVIAYGGMVRSEAP